MTAATLCLPGQDLRKRRGRRGAGIRAQTPRMECGGPAETNAAQKEGVGKRGGFDAGTAAAKLDYNNNKKKKKQKTKGLGGLRSLDLAVRSRPHYPDCATSPNK